MYDVIGDIMDEADEYVLATADQEEAARILSRYDLIVLPVVDEFHHLLGVLTYEDALEILQEESTEDIEKLAAISGETGLEIVRDFREAEVLGRSVDIPLSCATLKK